MAVCLTPPPPHQPLLPAWRHSPGRHAAAVQGRLVGLVAALLYPFIEQQHPVFLLLEGGRQQQQLFGRVRVEVELTRRHSGLVFIQVFPVHPHVAACAVTAAATGYQWPAAGSRHTNGTTHTHNWPH